MGRFILRYRAPIGIALLLITGIFGYYASKLTIGTSFIDFFPKNHPYVQLYHDYERYGGAQRLTLMVQVKHGDIFNYKTLRKIQDITFDVDLLPAVNHQSIRSLASFRVTYAVALPGNLVSKTYMYPNVPTSEAAIQEIKRQIFIHRQEMRSLVSDDGRSAAIMGSFYEGRLNYRKVFNQIQEIIKKYQDDNTVIYAAGEPMIRGYGYYYLPVLVTIFFVSDGIMILILYVFFKGRSTWWAPLITGLLSTVWGLGFIGWEGYEFDPRVLELPRPKVPRPEADVYHMTQLRAVLAACNPRVPQEELSVRILVGSGLRASELCGLALVGPDGLSDIMLDSLARGRVELRVRWDGGAKGHKARRVPITPKLAVPKTLPGW